MILIPFSATLLGGIVIGYGLCARQKHKSRTDAYLEGREDGRTETIQELGEGFANPENALRQHLFKPSRQKAKGAA